MASALATIRRTWDFAWALYAGVSYNVTKNFKVDLTYRYLNFGSITDTVNCNGGCNPDSFKFDKLYSQDIMLGLRWTCCDVAPTPPRYVVRPTTATILPRRHRLYCRRRRCAARVSLCMK